MGALEVIDTVQVALAVPYRRPSLLDFLCIPNGYCLSTAEGRLVGADQVRGL